MKLVSIREACTTVGLCRTTVWALIRDNKFPRPVQLTDNRKAFVESEIQAWISDRVAARDAAGPAR